jgi:hypothetical protein
MPIMIMASMTVVIPNAFMKDMEQPISINMDYSLGLTFKKVQVL